MIHTPNGDLSGWLSRPPEPWSAPWRHTVRRCYSDGGAIPGWAEGDLGPRPPFPKGDRAIAPLLSASVGPFLPPMLGRALEKLHRCDGANTTGRPCRGAT